MSLTSLLQTGVASNRADKVEVALRAIQPAEVEAFKAVITDVEGFSNPRIAEALNSCEGLDKPQISAHQVANFRRKLREGKVNLDSF